MKNRVSKYPGRVLLIPEDGSAPFYVTMERADEPTQAGDPLNKNTFLKDATAALFGLDPTAVPDDVLKKIATGFTMGGNLIINKVSGLFGVDNPNNESGIRFQESDHSVSIRAHNVANDNTNYRGLLLHDSTKYKTLVSALRLVDRKEGSSAADYYDILHTGNYEATNTARVASGSYEGTDEAEKTLTFSFTPKLVIVQAEHEDSTRYDSPQLLVAINGINATYCFNDDLAHCGLTWSGVNLTIKHLNTSNPWGSRCMNAANHYYRYIAIG